MSPAVQACIRDLYVYMHYLCFTPASALLIYVTAVMLLYLRIFIYTPALLVIKSYFSSCVCVCVCVCVCGLEAKCGAEERRSLRAWCLAAEGSW